MWYFTWVLGVGFAILLAILNGMWGEFEEDRIAAQNAGNNSDPQPDQPEHSS